VEVGERLEGVIVRMRAGREEAVRLPLVVADIAAVEAFGRDGLFVSVEVMTAVEDYLDGRAVPALGWEGTEPRGDSRSFAGFRLYASTLADVAQVERALRSQGIDVRTNAADIALVARLDRNLSAVYWMIAVIAVAGFCVSFATSVWANVDRKQREFSILRLTGFRTEDIVWFPVVQAVLMATGAWLLTCLAVVVIQAILNGMLASSLGGGADVCRLRAWHLVAALLLTIAAAAAAAASGGVRAARCEPSIGLRHG
jgi:putative ABC transport system permease protein